MCSSRLLPPIVAGLVALAAPETSAQQPSFDCSRASTVVEGAICGSRALSALDRELAAAYTARRSGLGRAGRDRLLAEQRRWLAARDRCGADSGCLSNAMGARIAALSAGPSPTATAPARLMGTWQPYSRNAQVTGAITLAPGRIAYASGPVFDLQQARPGSNVYRITGRRGGELLPCTGPLTHFAFTFEQNGHLGLHEYSRPTDPPDPPPYLSQGRYGDGVDGRCGIGFYAR